MAFAVKIMTHYTPPPAVEDPAFFAAGAEGGRSRSSFKDYKRRDAALRQVRVDIT
jgi:hypothetical protein